MRTTEHCAAYIPQYTYLSFSPVIILIPVYGSERGLGTTSTCISAGTCATLTGADVRLVCHCLGSGTTVPPRARRAQLNSDVYLSVAARLRSPRARRAQLVMSTVAFSRRCLWDLGERHFSVESVPLRPGVPDADFSHTFAQVHRPVDCQPVPAALGTRPDGVLVLKGDMGGPGSVQHWAPGPYIPRARAGDPLSGTHD